MVAGELVLPVGRLRVARAFNWEGRNVSEDSGALLALWRGPSIRRVGYRSEPRSNGRGPNAKYLPARPDVRHRAGQVRDGAARGQMPGGPGVRRSDEPLRDTAVRGQMPGGPGVRHSRAPLRDAAPRGGLPGGPGSQHSTAPRRAAA